MFGLSLQRLPLLLRRERIGTLQGPVMTNPMGGMMETLNGSLLNNLHYSGMVRKCSIDFLRICRPFSHQF
jgi:hypothetical protein